MRWVILSVMVVVLLVWILFCAVQIVRSGRDMAVREDFIARVKCEKCGTEYEVKAEEFSGSHMVKSISTFRSGIQNGAFVHQRDYRYYARKFLCPQCGKKHYAQVLNIRELNEKMTRPALQIGIRWMLIMVIGGVLVMAVAGIPLYFVDRAAKQQAEEMRQQRYEELWEEYMGEE